MYWGSELNIRNHLPVLIAQYEHLRAPGEVCPYPPLNLNVELSNRCNLRCISCFHSNSNFKNLPFMTMETFTSVLDQAAGHCDRLTFGNHGENMLHPEFLPMLRLAKERGFFINLITNATLLTAEQANAIIALGLDRIVFSLDSMDPGTYEALRVGARFDATLRNVLYFLKKNYEEGIPVYVNISTVNTKKALGGSVSVFDFFQDLPVHVVYTSDLLNFHGSAESVNEETYFETRYKELPQTQWPICKNGWDRMLIRADGDVALCVIDWDFVYSLGNVRDVHLMELWNNEKAQAYRRSLLKKDYRCIEKNGKLCTACDGKFNNSIERQREYLFQVLAQGMKCESERAKTLCNAHQRYENVCARLEGR